jgi:hypothetical protein
MAGILNAIVILAIFLFIFGIIGINYFKGGFYDCYRAGPMIS